MKLVGVLALMAAFVLAGTFWLRSRRGESTGTVVFGDHWLEPGTKGETSPEPLPPGMAGEIQDGDAVVCHWVWNRDLDLRYEVFEVSRDGRLVVRRSNRAGRFYLWVGGLSGAPILFWLVLLAISAAHSTKESRAL